MRYILSLCIFLKLLSADDKLERFSDYLLYANASSGFAYSLYKSDVEGGKELFLAHSLNTVATYSLKYGVKERRPDGSNTRSFPSGHTSVSFANATYLHMRYGFKTSLLAYFSAIVIAYTRVESDKHYFHDVVAGAIVGSLSSYIISSKYSQFQVTPQVEKDEKKFLFTFRF